MMLDNLLMTRSWLNVGIFFKVTICVLLITGLADKSICQVYNLEPSSLFWKLEALNYSQFTTRSGMSHVTMDTLSAVKTQIQQDLAKENKNNRKAQPKFTTAQVNRSKLPAHMARSLGPTAMQLKQEQLGEGTSTSSNISTTATVMFHGPKLDQESKKKRACE